MITIRHMQPAPFFFVIRGWNLVYKVETEAAKLKSSHSGLGPGLDVGLARLRQESLARVGGWGRKENRRWFPSRRTGQRAEAARCPSKALGGDGRYAAWVVIYCIGTPCWALPRLRYS